MLDERLTSQVARFRGPDQCGALCWRAADEGIEVLLVTSKTRGRWILPKGNVKRNETLYECARREAYEEAGVTGRIGKKAIGRIEYLKPSQGRLLSVSIFQMFVTAQKDDYPEQGFRRREWFSVTEAADLVAEAELRDLLLVGLAGFATGLQAQI